MIAGIAVALLLGALALLYQRWTRKYGTLEKLGIPVRPPFLCLGSGPHALHKHLMFAKDRELLGGNLTVGFYEGSQPVILTVDPDLIKAVYAKNFDHFQQRLDFPIEDSYKTLDLTHGEQWAFLRKSLSPVFTSGKIKSMVDPIEECTNRGLRYLSNKASASGSGGRVEIDDVSELMSAITLDVILNIAFGVEGNLVGDDGLNTDSAVYKKVRAMMADESSKSYLQDVLFLLFQLEPSLLGILLATFIENMKYLNGLVTKVVKRRDDDGEEAGDFIDRLRQMIKTVEEAGGKLHGVSPQMVKAQGSLFLFAGFVTTATALSNLVDLLSKNQEAQEKCYEDIRDNAASAEDVNYESVGKMKYVEACIYEALRLCPPVTRNSRVCTTDANVNGMEIRKGTRVDVAIYALHHCEEIYGEDADIFNPDRFVTGGKSTSDVVFHPFGFGPRQCLGMRFAMVEMKLVIAKLLFEFEILDTPGSGIKYQQGDIFLMSIMESKATLQKRAQ